MNLVKTLILEHKADVSARDVQKNTPLHVAALYGKEEVVLTLIRDFHCDTSAFDNNGNTPLHLLAAKGFVECLQSLLSPSAPLMVRNNSGDTPRDVATAECKVLLDDFMKMNSSEICTQYVTTISANAGVFVSVDTSDKSLIQALNKSSSVAPHTLGETNHRIYAFAGGPECFSTHVAVIECVASLRRDCIFLIILDMREVNIKIREIVYHWLSFIQHMKHGRRKPTIAFVGINLDEAPHRKIEELVEGFPIHAFLDNSEVSFSSITEAPGKVISRTRKLILLPPASLLLGLLEKDFSNVTVTSLSVLQSHIERTGLELPTNLQSLHSLLQDLCDAGLVFLVNGTHRNKGSLQIVLNMAQLSNKIHESLFSKTSRLAALLKEQGIATITTLGILPRSTVEQALPKCVTSECLVQLQYCLEIAQENLVAFPFFTHSNLAERSFLFFPALCSVAKGDIPWVTPSNLSYGIGWLARCNDPNDSFCPRFTHILLLRLVSKFTLSTPTPTRACSTSPDHSHFQRSCTMWKTGVCWLMEEGVECMVELVNDNREVAVLTKSEEESAENCISVFHRIISCVMEIKAEFCRSIKPCFFLLETTGMKGSFSLDNLFDISDVGRALICPDRREEIRSISGRKPNDISKLLLCMQRLTHWFSFFSIDSNSVLHYLQDVVDLSKLGGHLGIPPETVIAAIMDPSSDISKGKSKLVKVWLSSSLDPPCWWHLVQALKGTDYTKIVAKIKTDQSKPPQSLFCVSYCKPFLRY